MNLQTFGSSVVWVGSGHRNLCSCYLWLLVSWLRKLLSEVVQISWALLRTCISNGSSGGKTMSTAYFQLPSLYLGFIIETVRQGRHYQLALRVRLGSFAQRGASVCHVLCRSPLSTCAVSCASLLQPTLLLFEVEFFSYTYTNNCSGLQGALCN